MNIFVKNSKIRFNIIFLNYIYIIYDCTGLSEVLVVVVSDFRVDLKTLLVALLLEPSNYTFKILILTIRYFLSYNILDKFFFTSLAITCVN